MEVHKRITSLGSERGSDAGKRDARRADTKPDSRHGPTRQRLGVQLPGPNRPQGETPWAYSTGIRGATASEPEKFLALRARQSSRKHAARRTEVPPSKTSDCEGDWVCFDPESTLAKEGKATRLAGESVGSGGAGGRDHEWALA